MYITTITIAYDCPLQSLLTTLAKFGSPQIISYEPESSSGANPTITLKFESDIDLDDCKQYIEHGV